MSIISGMPTCMECEKRPFCGECDLPQSLGAVFVFQRARKRQLSSPKGPSLLGLVHHGVLGRLNTVGWCLLWSLEKRACDQHWTLARHPQIPRYQQYLKPFKQSNCNLTEISSVLTIES